MSSPTQGQSSNPNPNTPYHSIEDNTHLSSISPSTIFLHDGVLRSLHVSTLKEFEQQQSAKFYDALTISSVDQMEELMAIGLSSPTSPTPSGSHQNSSNRKGHNNNGNSTNVSTDLLSRKILKLSTLHVQTIGLHHRYQWHVLERAWRYQNGRALEKFELTTDAPTSSLTEPQFTDGDSSLDPNSGLGFKLSLCLMVPMLEMYSTQNNSVALSALQLLFSELSLVPVMSLSQESSHSLEKLEDLMGRWAANPLESFQHIGPSAMIALCCARGVISSFARTILMLENLDCPMRSLPVAQILRKLNNSRLKIAKPCAILKDKHVSTWPYDDRLMGDAITSGKCLGAHLPPAVEKLLERLTEEKGDSQQVASPSTQQNRPVINTIPLPAGTPFSASGSSPQDDIQKRFVATNGTFLFVTGPNGKGLSKIGTGLCGSLQGWVYHNNVHLKTEFLAYADGLLISRTAEIDTLENAQKQKQLDDVNNKVVLGVIIDQNTLKPDKLLLSATMEDQSGVGEPRNLASVTTLAMISDGSLLYFVKAEIPSPSPPQGSPAVNQSGGENTAPIQVWVDIYETSPKTAGGNFTAIPKFLKIPLTLKVDDGSSTTSGSIIAPDGNRITLTIGEDARGGGNSTSIRRTRSVRIATAAALPPPPAPPSGASNLWPGDLNTSINVPLKQLQNALYFTCGNYLTIVTPNNAIVGGSPLILASPTPSPIAAGGSSVSTARQYAPVISTNCIKSTGFQFHFFLQHTQAITISSKQDLSHLPPDSSFFHGGVIPEMGATYDATNNVIWTLNGNLVDCWKNPGHIPPWKQNKMLLLGNTTNDVISVEGSSGKNADVKTVINVMLRHAAVMANHYLTGDQDDANIGFEVAEGQLMSTTVASVPTYLTPSEETSDNNPGGVLKTLIELLCKYRSAREGSELTALFLSLRAIVSQISRSVKNKTQLQLNTKLKKELYNAQVMVLCLLNDEHTQTKFRDNPIVYQEACSLFAMTFDLLYTSTKARSDFFEELYQYLEGNHDDDENDDEFKGQAKADDDNEGDFEKYKKFCSMRQSSPECLRLLEDSILRYFTESLKHLSTRDFMDGMKWVVDIPWLLKVTQQSIKESKTLMIQIANAEFSEEEVIGVTTNYPVTSISTAYLNSVVDYFLKSLVLFPTSTSSLQSSSVTNLPSRNVIDLAVEIFREILKSGPVIVESILEVISDSDCCISYGVYCVTEAVLKSSLLGHGISQILGFLSLDNAPRPILDELTEECIQLTVAMSFLAKKMNPGNAKGTDGSAVQEDINEDWSSKVHVLSPWTTKRVFESPHPIRESFKIKDTIVVPGARQLYIKLSPQCATQYDYDRLSFLNAATLQTSSSLAGTTAGGAQPSKKILEFGGNYYGYGNRFFSGPGWARQLVKVCDGSGIQYNFEMKSGREHGVPDKALWGYQFTVFPLMDNSDPLKPSIATPEELPVDGNKNAFPLSPITPGFATITALHCIDVIQNLSRVLLEGCPLSPEEKSNKVLLENRLVAGLKWSATGREISNPPTKFSNDLICKVKRAINIPPLQMRLSIIEKIRASELEELCLQCCMAHVGPNPFLSSETLLSPVCESCWSMDPTRDVLREIFHNIDTMFRRLMAFYEMEKMLSQEIEEISNHTKDVSDAFFSDPSFMENSTDMQTLAWICYLEYEKDNPKSLITDVIAMCMALSADPSMPPQLTRTDELIEETHLKCKQLLQALPTSSSTVSYFGPIYPTQKMVIEKLQLIHNFISAHLYNPQANMGNFTVAVRNRRERAGDRIKGLDILHKVLECSNSSAALLIVTSLLLQSGPRLQSILCSGLEKDVLKVYGEVMKSTVGIAEKNPLLHRYTIALLSITAYDRIDEENLVESGLVGVLDQLCAYQTGHLTPLYQRQSPTQTSQENYVSSEISPEMTIAYNKASTLAWAAFQVLASQCASWERPFGHQSQTGNGNLLSNFLEGPASSEWEESEHRELSLQISINITNHLARAAALAALSSSSPEPLSSPAGVTCSPSLAVAIQDVLDLLNNLRTYKIGRAILKQSPCICRLLGLLQDSRLSPRLVLTILKLLHTALPLVDDLDTANFKQIVPVSRGAGSTPTSTSGAASGGIGNSSKSAGSTPISSFWSVIESTPYTQVASMLLLKLADYLVCGSVSTVTSATHSKISSDATTKPLTCYPGRGVPQSSSSTAQGLTDPSKYDRMEVWVYKSSHITGDHQAAGNSSSLIRQLFLDVTRQDLKPTRGTLTELENEMNASGKVLLYTDESTMAERKAMRISQLGYLVTLLPVGWSRTLTVYNSGITSSGVSSSGTDVLCKDRNNYLASWDPARPFLSGHVAENMSSEIVQLLRALLNTSTRSSSFSSLKGKSQSMSSLSVCGSRSNVLHQTESSAASLASTVIGGNGGTTTTVLCNGGDIDSLGSAASASAHLQMSGSSSQKPSTPSAWSAAVEQIVCAALKLLPKLSQMPSNPAGINLESYVYSARLVIAALTVLGGFTETIRNGLEVWIVDEPRNSLEVGNDFDIEIEDQWEYKATRAKVISVSDTSPTAKVELMPGGSNSNDTKNINTGNLRIADILTVPVSRLVPAHFTKCGQQNLPKISLQGQIELAGFLKSLLMMPSAGGVSPASTGPSCSKGGASTTKECPLKRELPTLNQIVNSVNPSGGGTTAAMNAAQSQSESRQIAQTMTIVRLLAEIRTKSLQVLSLWLKRSEFRDIFLGSTKDPQESSSTSSTGPSPEMRECIENLKELSKLCVPSHRANSLEYQVAWMRLLYRDCTKPPRLPISDIDKRVNGDDVLMRWDLSRNTPKIKCAVFSTISNSLVYTGDYNVSGGNPRGLVLFGNAAIPTQGYYWETTIVSMEEAGLHADLIVVPPLSIGFSPSPSNAATNNDIWKYPSGTVMYTTLGRVVHYKTQDPGSWISLRLDDDMLRVKAGDTIGIGWERQNESQSGGITSTIGPMSSQRFNGRGRRSQGTPIVASGRQTLAAVMLGFGSRNTARNTNQLGLDSGGTISLGRVYFTFNGRRLSSVVDQSNSNLHPILHVQKRQMIVSTNLGERPFLYGEANKVQEKAVKTVGRTIEATSASTGVVPVQRNATETATSNADVLLRRVSDSLQDLSLVFNMNINEFDSEPELPVIVQRSGSSSTISATSTRARRGDRVEIEEEDEDHDEADDDWNLDEEDNDDVGVVIAVEDEDDDDDDEDDDSDPSEGINSEPIIEGAVEGTNGVSDEGPGFNVLPPSPVSGASASGSTITISRAPIVPPPPPPPPPSSATRQRRNQRPVAAARSAAGFKKNGGKKSIDSDPPQGETKKKNQVTAKIPQKHTEYSPIKSLEYFLGHSPTASIKVFQGPRRYVCPCAAHTPTSLDHLLLQPSASSDTSSSDSRGRSTDIDSLDSFEDDDGEDDIHSQLVKAWEQQVFPVIRRRFRNDTERRDGLEQIRGALQLGMWDIARQTVEFLYEESGLPRDLHFPTLEEVRIEQARCTMDKLKPGMNVVIRPISQLQGHFQQSSSGGNQNQRNTRQQTPSSDMSLLPPPYAITGMLRTFGLTGEVLEVDVNHDLVLVETYIESEGVLVRFWYPVSCLDKSQSNKKPMLSTNTVNMFKLHSHLISLESCISHAYARHSYLSLTHHPEKTAISTTNAAVSEHKKVASKVTLLPDKLEQEFGLDSLQILSDACLSNYPPSRDLFTYNLQCETPPLKFLADPANPSVLFYHRGDHSLLSQHIRCKIRQCSQESSTLLAGEDPLDKLTESMLSCLGSPEKFLHYDMRLDRIHDLEVHCPGAAFVLVSFKGLQNMTAKQLNGIDNTNHPCFHVFSYDSNEITRYSMACYPLEPLHVVMHRTSSNTGEDAPPSILTHTQTTTAGAADSSAAAAIIKTMRKRHSRFPPVMCPTDRVYCSISEVCLSDITAEIQGLPKEFPLALLYVQELIWGTENVKFENITFAVSRLLDFLDQMHLCPVVKDWIFPLIADLTRIRSKDLDLGWRPTVTEKVARSSTPNRLFLELLLLRERETAELSLPTHTIPLISALGEHLEGGQPSTSPNKSHKGGKQLSPASLMFHISNFISSNQKSKRSMTEPNFSFYFNSLNDLCLALNEVSEIIVNPYEIIPCSTRPSAEVSPVGTPSRKASNTNTETAAAGSAGVSTAPSSQVLSFSAIPKRPLARASRKRQPPPSRDGFKVLKDFKKNGGGSGSGAGTSSATLGEKSTTNNGVTTKGGTLTTSSEDGFLVFAKASEVDWFNNQVVISRVLKNIVWHSPNDIPAVQASQVLIGTVLDKLKTPAIHNRVLVIQGAPVNIDGMSIEASLIRALRGCGGVHGNELWISENSAVVEIRSLAKVNEAYETLRQNYVWYPLEDYVLYPNVNVFKINEDLKVITALPTFAAASAASSSSGGNNSSEEGDKILEKFLKSKLADPEIPCKLNFKTREVLTTIFMSCYGTSIPFVIETVSGGESEGEEIDQQDQEQRVSRRNVIILSEEQMSLKMPGNILELFMGAFRGSSNLVEPEKDALTRFGEKMKASPLILDHHPDSRKTDPQDLKDGECTSNKSQGGSGTLVGNPVNSEEQSEGTATLQQEAVGLSLHGFLDWCTDLLKCRPNLLWKALFAAGYDLHLERIWVCEDLTEIYNYYHSPEKWQLEKDAALISYVDQFSHSLHIDPNRIQPSELILTESDFLNPSFSTLQGVPTDYLRVRWGMLQKMNTLISKKLLAQGSWHTVWSSRRSLANLLHASRQLLLYHTKDTYLYKITLVSACRGSDTPTPELILDPVSSIGSQDETVFKNQLGQVIQQMATITTAFYCVPPAQGADPALPLSVKFQGEEVLGLSGSFRHFLLSAAKELQNGTVKLLCRCPSADAGRNKDSFIITPGKLTYGEEDFLYFLGQLIGISIRSEAPLALPLLGVTWRALLLSEKESNDNTDDLVEADILCATYIRKLESFATKSAFDTFLSLNARPKFKYPSMDNTSIVPLCVDGSSIGLTFSNREQFIKMVKQFREKELRTSNKVIKILTGLASIVPLPALLGLFTSDHLALRIAGSPDVNLSLLKSHTHYQVGVSENDPHIMYFWAALESFSPEELKKFIKFSSNLERLPVSCPCQSTDHSHINQDSSSSNAIHVPPFPMKIAPIEIPPGATSEEIDRRLIRVETCLFLIRLPPYSSLQVTRQQLLFAINCREDPLSG